MTVKNLLVREIFDSRGEPTVEVCIVDGSGEEFFGQVPSGKSRGEREVFVLPPKAAKKAGELLNKKLRGKRFISITKFDRFLLKLDGTSDKKKFGGNVMLGASIAFTRGLAFEHKKEPWQILQKEFFPGKNIKRVPFIFSNVINGGVHANNDLDIQEYMIVVRIGRPVEKSVETLVGFYKKLGDFLGKRYKMKNLPIGDEGGYSLDFKNNFEPIHILGELIKKFRLRKDFQIGLDAAASGFYKGGWYMFAGARLSREELLKTYERYFRQAPMLVSVEDPFDENDGGGFAELLAAEKKKLIVGDDLTVTNPAAISAAGRGKLISGVIIKPNQIGTVSEACAAMKAAHKLGIKCIVSHRSGETADNFIIHLARAGGAYGVKIGAPVKERMSKFDELIRIYS
ncbi:MAG: hypothetical protein KGJ89_02955 [Patescibacteria group bacterium]|nr:hypothetical protein [Patescibacteria group bacterium]MDE2015491.1 hypothetical protein [Patescibacteria group bacterium]MDE2226893.1 hypothetical protein [Patescibacteria group bacterium]